MKAIVAVFVTALVLAGGAFATGAALDPRVPGLQRQIRAIKAQVAVEQAQLGQKVDKSCVEIVPMVIRPGYVYQLSDGSLTIYQAFDSYDASIDRSPNQIMQLKQGC